ncbi:MAG: hypoxanthine phosphoribosyltransferase [Candidatus Poribacteria bacterium]|nr:hypoxanthine phosphoribosyltransferase [Candidatus Poribacteria bacterium]
MTLRKPGQTVLSAERIQTRVQEIAAQISRDYEGKELTLVGVLKGSYIFLADLSRALTIHAQIDFIGASSYEGSESTGRVRWTAEPASSLRGQHVLAVEDIIDTGRTLQAALERLKAEEPASLRVCALLSKPARREEAVKADYVGFEIADRFLVGYGLDYDGWHRQLPYIAAMDGE